MMRVWKALLLAGCLGVGVVRAQPMIVLHYMDQDTGQAPYPTRILVTERYLRMDNGQDGDDFLLMDRKAMRMWNVTPDRKEILEIDRKPVRMAKPGRWDVHEKIAPAPARGKGVEQVTLYVNGVECSRITARAGIFPGVVAALKAYKETMAAVQADTFQSTPKDMRNDCDLALNVFEIDREFSHGLPLDENFQDGRSRRLESYREEEARPGLFVLPKNFRRINIEDLRKGMAGGKS